MKKAYVFDGPHEGMIVELKPDEKETVLIAGERYCRYELDGLKEIKGENLLRLRFKG